MKEETLRWRLGPGVDTRCFSVALRLGACMSGCMHANARRSDSMLTSGTGLAFGQQFALACPRGNVFPGPTAPF